MTVRTSDGWTKTVTHVEAGAWLITVTPHATHVGAGVAQNRDPARATQLRKSAHYGYTVRC